MSPKSTSACSPSDTRCEKPMPRARPVEHAVISAPDCVTKARLARQRADVREAGIQAQVRHQHADAVGAEDAQHMRLGGIEHGLALRLVEPGGEHHGGARARLGQLGDQPRHGGRRRADDGELGHLGQRGDARVDRLAVEFAVLGVDRVAAPLGSRCRAGCARPSRRRWPGAARRRSPRRKRGEKVVEMADAHGGPDDPRIGPCLP